MQHQPSRVCADLPDPDALAAGVLGVLVTEQPGLQTPHELALKIAGFSGDVVKARVQVEDALSDLMAHGLVHRLEGFVLASQAAFRSRAIGNG